MTTYYFVRTIHRPAQFKDERGYGYEFETKPPIEGAQPFRPVWMGNGLVAVEWHMEFPDRPGERDDQDP